MRLYNRISFSKILSPFILSVVIFACLQLNAAENISSKINHFLSTHSEMNAVYMIAQKDKILTAGTQGYFDLNTKEPLKLEQEMPIASGTKQMTAAMIMRLQERGLLNTTDTLGKLLPVSSGWWPNNTLPNWAKQITVHHLLTHTSGLAEYIPAFKLKPEWSHEQIKHAMVEYAINTPLTHNPGEMYSYNNTSYFFLGLVIEYFTKKSLGEVFRTEFFEPLSMNNSRLASLEEAIALQLGELKDYPTRYFGIPTGTTPKYLESKVDFFVVPYSDGGVISTVEDMVKWNKAFHNGKVVSDTSYQLMITPYSDAHDAIDKKVKTGYGVYIRTLDSNKVAYYHSGRAIGIRSEHGYIPADNIAFAILSNVMNYETPEQKGKIDYTIIANQFDIVYLREAIFKAAENK